MINQDIQGRTDQNNRPNLRRIWCLWFVVLFLYSLAVPSMANAAKETVIKVAFFPMDGYHIRNADGSYSGMDVEYLDEVCEYTGWKIQYVECASWEEALSLLSEKKVDLVGSAQYSAERAEEYLYADLSSGYTFGVIATNADGEIAYEDFQAMQGITFGMVTGYVRKSEFLQYLSGNGIVSPVIKEYETTAKLQQALDNGEIDALVHTFTEVKEGQRLIGRFAPRPFYYISYKGNDDMMRELNQAIADVKMNRPELEAELMNKFYYNRFDKMVLLTTEEKSYLETADGLTIGYLDGHYPFSYAEEGEFRGLSREMLEASFSVTGLKLNYRQMRDEQEAKEALEDGKIDILAYCTDLEEELSDSQVEIVREYADVPLVLVMDKRSSISEIHTMAVISPLEGAAKNEVGLQDIFLQVTDTQEEGLAKVAEGEVDAAICDGYLAEYLFRTEVQYENLQIKFVLSSELPIYVAVKKDNVLLSQVLSKTLSSIDSRMVTEYMLRENIYPLVSIKGFIRDHSVPIILFLLIVVMLVVGAALHIVRDERKIQKLMYKDTSLDIWNLNYLIYSGKNKLLPQKKNYAVVCLALSQFTRFNTIYGLSAGERLLNDIATCLKEQLDTELEICSRDHGDHFVLMLCFQNPDDLLIRVQNLKRKMEKNIYSDTGNRMSIRAGIYFLPQNSVDLNMAISHTEQALEFAERQEESDLLVYDNHLEQALKERHERENLLEAADPWKDFVTYYQPKVDIQTGNIVGAEALVRFLNPAEGGAVKAPGFFVPYYEQTGKITEIDFFVYESACIMLRRRMDAGEKVVPISCNFSRMHFLQPDFVERFESVLEKYQIPKELIEMEITETLVLEELQRSTVIETLKRLDSRKVRLSIDDFGSGYSSLGVFERIPASVVKLDRSFLLNRTNHERQVTIMRGIVRLANELKVQVVCEGVETDEDIALMREIGASIAQGYYYSKPIPEHDFEEGLTHPFRNQT